MNKIEIKSNGKTTNIWITTDEGRIKLDKLIYAKFEQESPEERPVIVLKFHTLGTEMIVEAVFTNVETREIEAHNEK